MSVEKNEKREFFLSACVVKHNKKLNNIKNPLYYKKKKNKQGLRGKNYHLNFEYVFI